MLFKKIGLATLALGSVLSLVPATAFATDRDDRYESRNGRDYRDQQRREHERREWQEQRRNRSYNDGYGYRNPNYDYNNRYANGYYDRFGNWHPYANRW